MRSIVHKNKKGSQVSMILSFIIFVVSLIFIYYIASASIYTGSHPVNNLDTVDGNVFNYLYSNVWVLRYNNANSGCVKMSLPETVAGANSSAMGINKSLSSEVSGNYVYVNGTGFMKVYYSDLIENSKSFSPSGCTSVKPLSIKKEKIIPENKIIDLIANFSKNYDSLKGVLGVPSQMDYELYFRYSNGSSIGSSSANPDTNIYSDELNIDYLSNNNTYENGTLRVKMW